MRTINTFSRLFLLLLAAAWFTSCQSDPSGATNNAKPGDAGTVAADQAGSGNAPAVPVDTRATMEKMLTQAKELAQQHEAFRQKFKALQDEVDAVPTSVKRNVPQLPDLQSRLEGYLGKGRIRTDELDEAVQTIQGLIAKGGGSADTGWDPTKYEPILREHQGAVAELTAQYEVLKKAVDRLKASLPQKGKGAVLFD